jgi:type II secretory ATPase GspE/PulE/Tfp pilus assembly ATPase PilB-like protein
MRFGVRRRTLTTGQGFDWLISLASAMSTPSPLHEQLAALDPTGTDYASRFVEMLLAAARAARASDVHLLPTAAGLTVRWRIDGVLELVGEFPRGQATDVVTRLKVLAHLLTYKTDVPQEGRIADAAEGETRVSTFPTLHGERAVVRLFGGQSQFQMLADLGLQSEIEATLAELLAETSGAILISGPAGSGKTTTAYAALREIVRQSQGRRSLVSLEDPIEMALDGVAQSQVNPAGGFDLATGLRSLMRQDPEVILVGEIRDSDTAFTAFQAALTGHLVLSTLHAGSAASGLARLIDMGLEPYVIRSGLRGLLNQRLLRQLCECATSVSGDADALLGLPIASAKFAQGCTACASTGYCGRFVIAEILPPLSGELGQAVLARRDASELARLATAAGMTSVFTRACGAVEAGRTDPAEVRRVLGFQEMRHSDFGNIP